VALAVLVIGQGLAYFATRLATRDRVHFDFGWPIDASIPLVAPFIVVYLSTFGIMPFVPFYLAKAQGAPLVKRYAVALAALYSISAAVYLVWPNDVARPVSVNALAAHGDVFDYLLRFIYTVDDASNGLPSLHNCHIWLPFFLLAFWDFTPKRALRLAVLGLFAGLTSLSTLLCKQHYLVDVLVSVPLTAAIAWAVTRGRPPAAPAKAGPPG
jgi:membrane-associated phospholipid phosphatase